MIAIRRINIVPIRSIATCVKRCGSKTGEPERKTALYDFHISQQGKMAPFAGYLMPIQYGNVSITQSHSHTRKHVSIFDVSHMLQSEVHGKDRLEFMESLVTGDIKGLSEGQGTLTLFTNPQGGIIDDLIVTKTLENHLYVVSNAGCRDKDLPLMRTAETLLKSQGKDVTLVTKDDSSLIALQGPAMQKVLQPLVNVDLSKLYFMNSVTATVAGVEGCRITRCGYTGEDGVEISMPSKRAVEIVETLLSSKADTVLLAGLGARDSLRLEAGLCLYGNDMDEKTTPVEAALGWLLAKRRKEAQDFPGAKAIMEQIQDKTKIRQRRVGFVAASGPPPRHGMEILASDGSRVGTITSGVPSPSLSKNIAMGYVQGDNHKVGTKLNIKVRNSLVSAEVVKMPFLKGKYYLAPKN
ncbi:Aminomethyltransferase, mitochondrial [Orchesella cincta]|uniref:Aminomethyltransferase n=1 Tax=Orchesella cincta TaxID=48709 RepID=A0A1D2N037_ORCCI|nr:Aminomethyltransferase, mitochondrial [Orchesella cincta]